MGRSVLQDGLGRMGGTATALALEDCIDRRLITGTGAHRYEMIHDWLTAPEGLVWGDTQGLAQDSQGLIYVAHTVNNTSMRPEAIVVYDAKGKFVRAFGEDMRGGAHGLGVRKEGNREFLYHCDTTRSKVIKTTLTHRIYSYKNFYLICRQ
jgi:hypothetical protein